MFLDTIITFANIDVKINLLTYIYQRLFTIPNILPSMGLHRDNLITNILRDDIEKYLHLTINMREEGRKRIVLLPLGHVNVCEPRVTSTLSVLQHSNLNQTSRRRTYCIVFIYGTR